MPRAFASKVCCAGVAGLWGVAIWLNAPGARAEEPLKVAIAGQAEAVHRPSPRPAEVITITLVGDTGFNGHLERVHPDGAHRHGTRRGWDDIFSAIKGEIRGDLVFANLETVVTERNELAPEARTFNFRSHPNGVRALAGFGFNLLSTANNHSYDFGAAGAHATIAALDAIEREGLIKAHAGLSPSREEALRPRRIVIKGSTVAFSAIGIGAGGYGGPRTGAARAGQLSYNAPADLADALESLSAGSADYRILSVHYGQERVVQTSAESVRRLRGQALLGNGIDLVVGHHSHVAAGLEITEGRLILYGLGNFLHPGMQSSAHLGICKDFGLMVRIHLTRQDDGRLALRALEAIPLAEMHIRVERMAPARARDRIAVLNALSARLDDAASGAQGVRLAVLEDGRGVHCAEGAGTGPGAIGALCAERPLPVAISTELRARIAASCGGPTGLEVAGRFGDGRAKGGSAAVAVRAASSQGLVANPFAGQ